MNTCLHCPCPVPHAHAKTEEDLEQVGAGEFATGKPRLCPSVPAIRLRQGVLSGVTLLRQLETCHPRPLHPMPPQHSFSNRILGSARLRRFFSIFVTRSGPYNLPGAGNI